MGNVKSLSGKDTNFLSSSSTGITAQVKSLFKAKVDIGIDTKENYNVKSGNNINDISGDSLHVTANTGKNTITSKKTTTLSSGGSTISSSQNNLNILANAGTMTMVAGKSFAMSSVGVLSVTSSEGQDFNSLSTKDSSCTAANGLTMRARGGMYSITTGKDINTKSGMETKIESGTST